MSAGGCHQGTIEDAIDAISAGEVVAIPTDTVYGLAVSASDPLATGKLFAMKGRPPSLDLPVLVEDLGRARNLGVFDALSLALAERFWPGPLTLVVRRSNVSSSLHLGGDGTTIGLRAPAAAMVMELCERVGPLASTSANPHGSPPFTSAAQILKAARGGGLDGLSLVVDGGICNLAPSTVLDCTRRPVVCLREGAVRWRDVQEALQQAGRPSQPS
ncbi:MAG: L-threonylcarbamoyladenylate synthase [Actinobacteria bacterium]|nr:L-threonylcarbamoyladenylate synthase [Actinomycetota bacterium]